ncbi:TadG family pilus assembly protein [Desulfopila inferna]|uniref:TadG family pilus assembly protein n=1 Tax=Desulfopila inferna TaxID=468528 RepID=UPI0019641220|nr:TadG family pilus assembly protein [Desulfopila inferna]MBM9603825.1 hypothetical protein [Desulfopila inferna]
MRIYSHIKMHKEKGATAVYVAVVLTVLLMFSALAIDVGHLYGVRNELHNAADAAALAGAANLFNDDGSLNSQAAIAEAERIASSNRTGNQLVVEITAEPGHWSFSTREFTANFNTTQIDWQEQSFGDLDSNTDFINAVRVRADRSDTPSFLARILGFDQFFVSNDAVAYIGFAGTLFPGELDQPIAICQESITDADGNYSCNMGRMLNSGGNVATSNTGGWTNFSQPCGTASASEMTDLVCAGGNTEALNFGNGIGATGGVQNSTLSAFYDCWRAATNGVRNWSLTLPVVECPQNNVGNCVNLVGAVTVDILWMIPQNDPQYNDVPREMTVNDDPTWTCTDPDGFACWQSFVDNYGLANVNGRPVTAEDYEVMYQNKNIFFLPSCIEHRPTGVTGGENFGILAEYPLLVE